MTCCSLLVIESFKRLHSCSILYVEGQPIPGGYNSVAEEGFPKIQPCNRGSDIQAGLWQSFCIDEAGLSSWMSTVTLRMREPYCRVNITDVVEFKKNWISDTSVLYTGIHAASYHTRTSSVKCQSCIWRTTLQGQIVQAFSCVE